jgi:hypothetical protein
VAVVAADRAPLPSQLDPAELVRRFLSSGFSILAWAGCIPGGKDADELGPAYAKWLEGERGERVVIAGEAVGYPPGIRGEYPCGCAGRAAGGRDDMVAGEG